MISKSTTIFQCNHIHALQQTESPGYVEDNQIGRRGPRRSLTKQDKTKGAEEEQPTTGGALEYTCQVCGRSVETSKNNPRGIFTRGAMFRIL